MDNLGAAGLRFERQGPIGCCTIDRPAARNALTPAMYFGIKGPCGLEESPEPHDGMRAFMEKRSPSWVPAEFAKTANGIRSAGKDDPLLS